MDITAMGGYYEFVVLMIFIFKFLAQSFAESDLNIATESKKPPHIIFILADDLGFNDVGFHGSAEIPTPNIDALAFSGLILNSYYATPICTPSRSALMTGKYPIHTGMQHTVLYGTEPRGLPLTEKLLPEYLNELGYCSHIAGKWHLGHYKEEYTPMRRGFKTHVGFWTGHHDYFDHTAMERGAWGLDFRKGLDVGYKHHGRYTTDIITEEAVRVISAHNATSNPLFLYIAHAAVHSGNPYNPLPAPDDAVAKMKHIEHYGRRRFAGVLSKLDESIGKVVQELQKNGMLKDSIIIFSSDNGGPAEGFNINHASNWPLRGVKNTLFEGGVRVAGFLWSPLLNKTRRVADQTIHITDWLPTLLGSIDSELASSLVSNGSIDGMNIWPALSEDGESPRKTILHNIDNIWGSAAVTVNEWKVVRGTNYKGAWDGWYGPAGDRNAKSYYLKSVFKSPAGKAIASLKLMPTSAEIMRLRQAATVDCKRKDEITNRIENKCQPLKKPCLFNIREDPCELYNLADVYPTILEDLLGTLNEFNKTAVPPSNKKPDPKGDPRFWDYTWTNFGDFQKKL